LLLVSFSASPAQTVDVSVNAAIDTRNLGLGRTTLNVPVTFLGGTANVGVGVVATPTGFDLLPSSIQLPINLLGRIIDLPVTVLPAAAPAGSSTLTIPITIALPASALTGAINQLDAVAAARRNDLLLGLDLGLDRQIALLSPGSGGNAWPKPYGLSGPRLSAISGEALAGLSGEQEDRQGRDPLSFTTSLQAARNDTAADHAPFGLGATARPAPSPAPAFDVWIEGSAAWFSDGSSSLERHGDWSVLYVGADYRLSRDVLVGALVQFDRSAQDFEKLPSRGNSSGWMAGPYATVRLSDHLFLQTRAAWGTSDVDLGIAGIGHDRFDTERWLARATVLGQWQSGPWQFRPRASVGYIEEHQPSYVGALGLTMPEQNSSLGQVKAGPEFAYRYALADGTTIEPRLLVEGIWNFKRDSDVLLGDDQAFGDRLRGRAETGITLRSLSGLSVGAAVSYDGIGGGSYQALGAKARVQLPFN
jgi:outer membrane autotransporter protein